jgi:hypothetical protein
MLACALFMSYSRGGLAVTAAALAALIALRPNLRQAAIAVAAPLTGRAGALVADRSKEIKLLSGSLAERSSAGQSLGIVLLLSTLLVVTFAWLLLRLPASRNSSEDRPERLLYKPLRAAAALVACLALCAPIAAALLGTPSNVNKPSQGQAGINRLQTADSDRQLYWKIAWQQFRSHPVKGTGSGAFRLAWVQSRYAAARPSVNAHSLEIETGAELGLIGLAALAAFLGGIALAARKAWRRDPRLCSAAAAGSILMFGHTAFDWDWQLPGVMLPALLLCALLVAQSEPRSDSRPSSALGSRIAVGLIALVAGGWLVHDWRSAELIAQAGKKLDAARVLGFTPQRYASIQDLLSQAEWLSADSEAARSKAITTILAGHPREGIDELKRLLANDPYDYLSWVALSRVSFRIGDQADFDLAQRALQSFHPALTGDGAAQAH